MREISYREMSYREISYAVRGYLTVRRSSLRVPLAGSLALRVDTAGAMLTGDLQLAESVISRTAFGARLLRATVQITPRSRVVGGFGSDGELFAALTVDAAITSVQLAGRPLLRGCACRTASQAVVPLRSGPGFDLDRGGRLAGSYRRPPFTGCGAVTPVINLLAAGAGNTAVVNLIPVAVPRDATPTAARRSR
jgi:hypothetical protein